MIFRKPILLLLVLAGTAVACRMVGETGRNQLAFVPVDYMNAMGASAYEEATAEYPLITSGRDYEMVQRAGARIAEASGRDYEWEFRLLDAPGIVNAFCLPGGKVAVYSGILPITKNEDGLAAVVGHEVAHATSAHGNERMSQQFVAQGVFVAADIALDNWTELSDAGRTEWMAALGLGAQVGFLLPYSRTHESEADEIGLRFAVRAGYDPYEAPRLWERMAELAGDDRPSELMSTHPDPLRRAERLRELIPGIVAEESGTGGTR